MTTVESDAPKVWPKYLRDKYGYIQQANIRGETTRSWAAGPSWDQRKWAKKDYAPATEQDWENQLWRDEHEHRISRLVSGLPYGRLKEVADLIGYDERWDGCK